jgi:hypothetical protein
MEPLKKLKANDGTLFLSLNGRAVAKVLCTEAEFDEKLSAATAAPRKPARSAPDPAPTPPKAEETAKKTTKRRRKP